MKVEFDIYRERERFLKGWAKASQAGFIGDFRWEREYIAVDNYVPFFKNVTRYSISILFTCLLKKRETHKRYLNALLGSGVKRGHAHIRRSKSKDHTYAPIFHS